MEFWDIYDENKQPTGRTMKRNDWCLKDGEYHLTVLGVVARPDDTFLITKRVMTKAWAPGWWEVSGGAAQAGESSYEAVLREVKEETGLDARDAEGGYLFTYRKKGFIFFQPASVCDHIQFQGFCYLFSCKFHFVSLLPFKCFADAVVMEEFTLCGKRLDLLQGCKHMSICLLRLQ